MYHKTYYYEKITLLIKATLINQSSYKKGWLKTQLTLTKNQKKIN